jgi:ABC-2 type transport system ATP-binding protein
MHEAEYLADRVAIIVKGKIVAEGGPRDLAADQALTTISFRLPPGERVPDAVNGATQSPEGLVTIRTLKPTAVLFEVTRWATQRNLELEQLDVSRPSLEDTFLELVGDSQSK